MQAKEYRPSSIPLVGVQLYNLLCTRARTFEHASPLGPCAWSIHAQAAPFPCAVRLRLRAGSASWTAALSTTEFLLLHPAMPDDPALDERVLPAEVRRALLESCAAPVAEALGALLGTSVSITEIIFPAGEEFVPAISCSVALNALKTNHCGLPNGSEPDPSAEAAEDFPASAEYGAGACAPAEDGVLRFTAGFAPEGAGAVAELLRMAASLPRVRGGFLDDALLGAIPLEAAVCAGTRSLSPEDAASLEPGDILIPQEWLPERGEALLAVRSGSVPCMQGSCSFSDGRAVLTSPLSQESAMENGSDIEITLTFELGSRRISLGDLASLAPGYVFDLPENPEAPVTVRANGKAVARGRLVDLGGTLGVQLLEAVK